MNYQIIAVDFDGTLCFSKWPELGEPNQPLIEYLQDKTLSVRKEQGAFLIDGILFFSDTPQLCDVDCDGSRVLNVIEDGIDIMAHKEKREVLFVHEVGLRGMVQHIEQRVIIAVGIEYGDGLCRPAELL